MGASYLFGAQLELICDKGFRQISAAKMQCGPSGKWEGAGVACEAVTCPRLSAPGNGAVVHTDRHGGRLDKDDVLWGASAMFACQEGYQLVGSEVSECQEEGAWSHTDPQCQSKRPNHFNFRSPGVWCSPLDTPAHGFMMGVGRQFGDIVRFACQQGHRLFGEQELVCGPQGAWSDNPPSCHRVWCDPPVLGSGVRLPEAQSQGSHPHRAILELECREGHQARGDLRITCQANGRWSRPEGACHSKSEQTIEKKISPGVPCGRPSMESGVTLLSSTFVFGSKVPFTCPSGETERRSCQLLCLCFRPLSRQLSAALQCRGFLGRRLSSMRSHTLNILFSHRSLSDGDHILKHCCRKTQ